MFGELNNQVDVLHSRSFNSSSESHGGWKTILSYWVLVTFQGQTVKLREGNHFNFWWFQASWKKHLRQIGNHFPNFRSEHKKYKNVWSPHLTIGKKHVKKKNPKKIGMDLVAPHVVKVESSALSQPWGCFFSTVDFSVRIPEVSTWDVRFFEDKHHLLWAG